MDSTDQESDQLLNEIIQLELEIDKIMALNGNREDVIVQRCHKFIQAKKNKMNKMNFGYKNLLPIL